jgi:hypothetical protein
LTGLSQRIALTASDVSVAQAASLISDQTGYSVIVDPRWRDLRVSLMGIDGTLGDALAAVCLATGLEPRRLERWIILSPSARGVTVVARAMRQEYVPRLARDRDVLVAQRQAAANRAAARLRLETPADVLAQLDDFQRVALQAQGYLTVAQLFPQFYLPLYDVFGRAIDGRAERPPSLPEFAETRVFLDPALRLGLHIPGSSSPGGAPPAGETVWPIDIIRE